VGITFILTTLAVFAVLLGDIIMQIIDPRIQFATKSKAKSKNKLAKGEK
jgi:oligopeptide transport system permease protein